MGSSKSKVAKAELNEKLDVAEKKHASAAKTIVVREEELERCKQEAASATSENESLKRKTDDLEARYEALQKQRTAEVEGLKKELAHELEGQVRIHESLTQERNRERRRVEQLEKKMQETDAAHAAELKAAVTAQDDKIRTLEHANGSASQEAEAQLKQLQAAAEADKQTLDAAKKQALQLEERVQTLEAQTNAANDKVAAAEVAQSNSDKAHIELSDQLNEAKSALATSQSARSEWEEKHNDLFTRLTSTTSSQDSRLSSLHSDLSTSQQKQKDLNKQVTTLQKRLDLTEGKRSDMEKKYNEGVSKKSALHEAFEATKLELKDSYERYAELHQEVTKLRAQQQGQHAEHPAVKAGVNGALVAAQAAMKEPDVKVDEVKADSTKV